LKKIPSELKKLLRIELNPDRIYGLDILRALAILFVVAGHGEQLIPEARYKYVNFFLFDGVSIFFVLSGFLIGGILIKILQENSIDSKLIVNFWIKRWFRTLPNYFLVLIVLLSLNLLFIDNFSFHEYKSYFLFSQNLFSAHPDFFREAWSLSVEEWFYLLIPVLLFILIKALKISVNNAILLCVFSIIISITLFRYFRYATSTIEEISVWDKTFRKQVFTRLDSLMYGVIGAYVYYHFADFWNKYRIQFLISGLALFIFMKFNLFDIRTFGLYSCVFSFSFTSIATLLILPYLSSVKSGKGFVFKLVTYISLISYSMYLINFTIVQKWILGNIEWSVLKDLNSYVFLLTRYSIYWLLTVVISILMYKYFEIPFMNLRTKVRVK
jgi:peptidoglycan/LPS O-acetylase OafA/YrhL